MGIIDCREFNPITVECIKEKIAYYEKFYESKNQNEDDEKLLSDLFPYAKIIDLQRQKVEKFLDDFMGEKEAVAFYNEKEKIDFRNKMKSLGIYSKNKLLS